MNLQDYGWNNNWQKQFEAYKHLNTNEHLTVGRVLLEHKHSYRVMTEFGEWMATPSGHFQYNAQVRRDYPVIGDWVVLEQMPGEEKGMIHAILPRTSLFSRKVAGSSVEEQIIAVNINYVFLVMSLNKDFNLRRLERYLIAAYDSGANPIIVLTKKDLCEDPSEYVDQVETIAFGVPIYTVSSLTGEGIDLLQQLLSDGKTGALLGSSGVGKSSLTNALCEEKVMSVQTIRTNDDKGRHTTTHRELFQLPTGGLLIDTPGMREFQLWNNSDSLDSSFNDIETLAQHCRFRDCEHKKEPGCAVKAAIEEGTLEKDRYDSYFKLKRELAFIERKANTQAQLAERSRGKNTSKQIKKNTKR
ncbi:ribosome small subunit-dependent GTPase A [Rummeliibacillus sp. TYF005]|uniref:ribosome small subunit-dependent GTPase A n=1 Tax=unclassified Rummeliibacillus TaxID=2622809 RepID=UPI000E66EA21|nr:MULTISPECIES: ribosome small subunit-dependent GTPase A [unclassified Rummeliibacillus]RIJ67889.1 ribosome small subunit-dependent GTPase A [Rummeliibacillus sp. POC4]RPJ95513.1 ribosome small subunit-dependent GTPase A [Rummeliibacillus sp. TYF005]